jgi:putative hydrolase of the HAD superfamily
MTLRGVVFDLDDTLTDFSAVEAEIWTLTLDRIRAALPDVDEERLLARHLELREFHYDEMLAGRTDLDGYRRAHLRAAIEPWGELPDDVLGACVAERDAHVDRARLADGAREAVRALRERGLRVGVLTNGPGPLQRRKLAAIGLGDEFDAVCPSGELGVAKPDPRAFAIAAERLGSTPAQTAMVGDNPVVDAVGAGVTGVASLAEVIALCCPD